MIRETPDVTLKRNAPIKGEQHAYCTTEHAEAISSFIYAFVCTTFVTGENKTRG